MIVLRDQIRRFGRQVQMLPLHLVLNRLAHNEAPGSLSSRLLLQFLVGIIAELAAPLALFVPLKALVLVE